MLRIVLGTSLFLVSSAAFALIINIDSYDNGWYWHSESPLWTFHASENGNTYTGLALGGFPQHELDYHSFATFDLSALRGLDVSAAELTFFAQGAIYTEEPNLQIGIYDYLGSIDALLRGRGGTSPLLETIWHDLGSGLQFGESSIDVLQSPVRTPEISLSFNAFGIEAIRERANALDSRFAFGVALLGNPSRESIIWVGSGNIPSARLSVKTRDIDEPNILPLIILAVVLHLLSYGPVGRKLRYFTLRGHSALPQNTAAPNQLMSGALGVAMARDGKNLERLVEFVEKTLLPEGFSVTTNDRVFDDEGTQIAEFDIRAEGKVGTTDFSWLRLPVIGFRAQISMRSCDTPKQCRLVP